MRATRRDPYLLPKLVPNLIKIFFGEECLLTPISHPFPIRFIIMQGKDRLNVLPLPMLRCNVSTAFFLWKGDQLINNAETLCFRLGLGHTGSIGLLVTDTIKPVTDSGSVGLISDEFLSVRSDVMAYLDLWMALPSLRLAARTKTNSDVSSP